eukprot:jgi/Tetstr1/447112/TSEL_034550.t1
MATEPATALAHPTIAAAPSRHSVNVRRGACMSSLPTACRCVPAPRCSMVATQTPLMWLAALAAGCPRGPACHYRSSSPPARSSPCGAALLLKPYPDMPKEAMRSNSAAWASRRRPNA